MTRVLAITNWYPPHHYGGYELICFDVMTRFEQRGHEVRVLCSDQRLSEHAPTTDHERHVDRSLRLYHTGEEIKIPSLRGRLAIERHNQTQLLRVLDEFQPDVVSAWHFAALSFGLLTTVAERQIPVVFSMCDEWANFGLDLDQWAKLFNKGALSRSVGRIVSRATSTPTVVDDIGTYGPALYISADLRSRIRARSRFNFSDEPVVYAGIDRTVFEQRDNHSGSWKWRLIATGRFDPRKGFETAIRALAHLPREASLSVFGRGGADERRRLEVLAVDLGVEERVEFGTLERHELSDAYTAGDVYVFPSEWNEPLGLVPIEAMACGTPVIGTGDGGSSEYLIDGQNCLRFDPGDAEGLASQIRRLAADTHLRMHLIAGGLATAEAMDVERLADVMEDWHVHVASGGSGEPPVQRQLPWPV